MRPISVCVILLAGLLAGCVGSEEAPAGADVDVAAAPEEVVVTDRFGSIKGSLTSDLFEPLAGGVVTIVETGSATKVARNGHFTVNEVEPGTYVLHFAKDGYASSERQVVVAAGEITEVFVQLVPAAGEDPWSEQQEISGQVTYNVQYHIAPGGDCVAVPNDTFTVRTCDGRGANLIFGIHTPNITATMQTALYEATWRSATVIGEHLNMFVLCPTYADDRGQDYYGDPCFIEAEGSRSPLIIRTDRADLEEVIPYTGDWYFRIGGGAGILGTKDLIGVDIGAAYEQKFTLFFTFFHLAEAPEGYTALPDE